MSRYAAAAAAVLKCHGVRCRALVVRCVGVMPYSNRFGCAGPTFRGYRAERRELFGAYGITAAPERFMLTRVCAQLAEYIPFGSNQIVALNERLGALDRCKGGLFTAMVDSKPTDTHLTVNPGHTQVSILDFELVRCVGPPGPRRRRGCCTVIALRQPCRLRDNVCASCRFINFSADIYLPEEAGIVQVCDSRHPLCHRWPTAANMRRAPRRW
jgi:hypothetical protein